MALEEINDSPLERAAQESLFDDSVATTEGEPGAEPPPAAPAPSPQADHESRFKALEDGLKTANDRAFAAEQTAQFLRGRLSSTERAQAKPDEPKPFVFDESEWNARIEKESPAKVLYELANKLVEDKVRAANREVETKVDGKFGQIGAASQREAARQRMHMSLVQRYGDVVATPEFIADGNKVIIDIACEETGKSREELTAADFTPSMARAAAAQVYEDWAKGGKLPKPSNGNGAAPKTLREIVASVPKSDSLGSNGSPRNGASKNGSARFEETYRSETERAALGKIMKGFGMDINKPEDRAEWMKNMADAAREDEDFGR